MNPLWVFLPPYASMIPIIIALQGSGEIGEHMFAGLMALLYFGWFWVWPLAVLNYLNAQQSTESKININFYNAVVLLWLIVLTVSFSLFANNHEHNIIDLPATADFMGAIGAHVAFVFYVWLAYLNATLLEKLERESYARKPNRVFTTLGFMIFILCAFHIRDRILALTDLTRRQSLETKYVQEPFKSLKGGIHPDVRERLEKAITQNKNTRSQ